MNAATEHGTAASQRTVHTTDDGKLQNHLLAWISPSGSEQDAPLAWNSATFNASDWESALAMASQHRLLPLWHWQHQQRRQQQQRHHAPSEASLPAHVSQILARSFEIATRRALALQRELLNVHTILSGLGIDSVALKGIFLALYAYPHPALRPLRDLDILVPRHQALQAHAALVKAGFTPVAHAPKGSAESNLDTSQHLPGLKSPLSGVNVELHTRLFHLHADEAPHHPGPVPSLSPASQFDLADDPAFWMRCVSRSLAGQTLRFESPTDLLFHLIVHAAYDHEFTNGPLVLSDIAFLLRTHAIDSNLFWQLALQRQQTRGCALLLRLTAHYWGRTAELDSLIQQQPVLESPTESCHDTDWPLQLAAHAMLRDFNARNDVKFGADVAQHAAWADRWRVFLSKAFRPRSHIAAQYPVSEHSPWVFFWYPVEWARLTLWRLPAYVWSLRRARSRQEMQRIGHLRHWLAQESPPAARSA